MAKRNVTFTISIGKNNEQISTAQFIKELLKAILVYATIAFVPTAIVIIILAAIFKFNILIPLLISVPAALILGLLIIVLSARINDRPDELTECSKELSENGFLSEENLNKLLARYEHAGYNKEAELKNLIIILLSNHFRSAEIQQPNMAAKYLSKFCFDDSKQHENSEMILRLNYYVSSMHTYLHLDDAEKLDHLYSESAPLFEECGKLETCKAVIRRLLYCYYLYKNELDRAAEVIAEETDKFYSTGLKADLLAEQGRFNDARQLYREVLTLKLNKLQRKRTEQQLIAVDLLENGKMKHIYDYIPLEYLK